MWLTVGACGCRRPLLHIKRVQAVPAERAAVHAACGVRRAPPGTAPECCVVLTPWIHIPALTLAQYLIDARGHRLHTRHRDAKDVARALHLLVPGLSPARAPTAPSASGLMPASDAGDASEAVTDAASATTSRASQVEQVEAALHARSEGLRSKLRACLPRDDTAAGVVLRTLLRKHDCDHDGRVSRHCQCCRACMRCAWLSVAVAPRYTCILAVAHVLPHHMHGS